MRSAHDAASVNGDAPAVKDFRKLLVWEKAHPLTSTTRG
jgi:hypothetical protein